ncbi:hypothetical protein [Dyadobacter sp. 32]|uniref:hypothetical protein n=1 Tax=Dyadobacter sp. 32 TaxID=538966 RepID=UPI0011EF3F39
MSTLPSNFPTNLDQISITNLQRVQWFYRQFVEDQYDRYCFGHFLLAAYASIPAQLTPDLLYQIWQNFNSYNWLGNSKNIHRIAVADVLLSPLCREVGYELYEMHEDVKLGFLQWLHKTEDTNSVWETRKISTVSVVASFVAQYHEKPNSASERWGDAHNATQKDDAISYLNPESTVKILFDKAKHLSHEKEGDANNRDIKLIHTLNTIQKIRTRFNRLNIKTFENIGNDYLEKLTGLRALIQNDTDELNNSTYNSFFSNYPTANSIAIPSRTKNELVIKPHRKVKVFIVAAGNSKADISSAELFSDTIKKYVSSKDLELEILLRQQTTADNILKKWKEFAESVEPLDDVVFYIAANGQTNGNSCKIICHPNSTMTPNATSLKDKDIGDIANGLTCASVTMILQVDHAATTHWLDTNKPKNIVFASSKFEQKPRHFNVNEGGNIYCVFTHSLVEVIHSTKLLISNRQLFIEALALTESKEDLIREPSNESLWEFKSPQLLGNPISYNQFFGRGKNQRAELQNLLRYTGYLDELSSGLWDTSTANAFSQYCKKSTVPANSSKAVFIEEMKKKSEHSDQEAPLYLLIFSDPYRQLNLLAQEKEEILKRLHELKSRLIVLDTPSKAELTDELTKNENRNRIALVYYSGMDNKGNFVLKDGSFSASDFGKNLDYQENIQLFVSNTCRSGHFAEFMTQLGVRIGVGAKNLIDDNFAYQWGSSLFEHLLSDGDIKKYVENFKMTSDGAKSR